METRLFAGAKRWGDIRAYENQGGVANFLDSIDWGWFFFLTKPIFAVLYWLNGIIGNLGWSIIALTLIIKALLLTDVSGVKNEDGEILTELSAKQIGDMTDTGTIAGGMIPKTQTALTALESGVRAVVILDGRVANACLLELFTDHGAGSIIRN